MTAGDSIARVARVGAAERKSSPGGIQLGTLLG
jgi:hypothetical protein